MKMNFKGLVDLHTLPKTTPLLPLYEAIINSIQSIEDAQISNGKIEIIVERDKQMNLFNQWETDIENIIIVDNGIGFDDENYNSFDTYASEYKIQKGCKSIYISTNEAVDSIQFVNSMKDRQDILYSMSSGQLSAVAISFLLCMNQVYGKHNPCSVLLIDDPVQTIDDVNMVGLVDLLRYEFEDRQIFISTHEQTFEWFLRYRYSKANKAVKIFNMKEIMLNEE